MLNCTKKIKQLYEEIQRTIFYAIPGKWDELYLYASVIDKLGKLQTGEMYFYFMPKGILKRKYINVYEVPEKFDIEEEQYFKLVDILYEKIKELRKEFENSHQALWSNLTISIKNTSFKIEYNYDNLIGSTDEYYNHHVYWRNQYLNIEPHGKKEKEAIKLYEINRKPGKRKNEEYIAGIYLKRKTNIVTYDTLDFKQNQRVDYLVTEQETKKITNQILSNK